MPLWQSSKGCRNPKEIHSCCLSFQRDFHLSIKRVIHKSTYKVRVSTSANYLLNQINIVGSDLTGIIKPPGRACSRRYDDSTALELAHTFIVHFNPVHARAWHVFLCSEHFIEAQLAQGNAHGWVLDLKERPCPVVVLELAGDNFIEKLWNLLISIFEFYLRIKKGAHPSGRVWVNA